MLAQRRINLSCQVQGYICRRFLRHARKRNAIGSHRICCSDFPVKQRSSVKLRTSVVCEIGCWAGINCALPKSWMLSVDKGARNLTEKEKIFICHGFDFLKCLFPPHSGHLSIADHKWYAIELYLLSNELFCFNHPVCFCRGNKNSVWVLLFMLLKRTICCILCCGMLDQDTFFLLQIHLRFEVF